MEIEQVHIVLRSANFDRTCSFYEQVLGLTRLSDWEGERGDGARFALGGASLEVLGRGRGAGTGGHGRKTGRDEAFDYQGPQQKMTLAFTVPSAEKAYEELLFRDRNIPGGLYTGPDGTLVFETHDPDGVRILFRQSAG